jgi:hypothetical protein
MTPIARRSAIEFVGTSALVFAGAATFGRHGWPSMHFAAL